MDLKLGHRYYNHDLELEMTFKGYFDNGDLWFEDDDRYSHVVHLDNIYLLDPVVMDVVDELDRHR